jgi:hypothetical protein
MTTLPDPIILILNHLPFPALRLRDLGLPCPRLACLILIKVV